MPQRKTFKIEVFKEYVNKQLERTDDFATQKFKAGLCLALEEVLFRTGNYNGYNYNYWIKKGFKEWQEAGEPGFPEKNKYLYGKGGHEYNRFYS